MFNACFTEIIEIITVQMLIHNYKYHKKLPTCLYVFIIAGDEPVRVERFKSTRRQATKLLAK